MHPYTASPLDTASSRIFVVVSALNMMMIQTVNHLVFIISNILHLTCKNGLHVHVTKPSEILFVEVHQLC